MELGKKISFGEANSPAEALKHLTIGIAIIKKQLEFREVRPEVFESSTFASPSLSCAFN